MFWCDSGRNVYRKGKRFKVPFTLRLVTFMIFLPQPQTTTWSIAFNQVGVSDTPNRSNALFLDFCMKHVVSSKPWLYVMLIQWGIKVKTMLSLYLSRLRQKQIGVNIKWLFNVRCVMESVFHRTWRPNVPCDRAFTMPLNLLSSIISVMGHFPLARHLFGT